VDEFYIRIVVEKCIDVLIKKQEMKPSENGKDLQAINIKFILNKDIREIGSE